jgi:predicted aminopeptidase
VVKILSERLKEDVKRMYGGCKEDEHKENSKSAVVSRLVHVRAGYEQIRVRYD